MEFQMPRPGAEHDQLRALAGKWTGAEVMHPGPMDPGGKSVGFTDARIAPDGFHFVADYRQECGGKCTLHGHSVLGDDTFGRRYLWYWVDSMGMPPPSATPGQFEGRDFVFENDTPHGRTRYTYSLMGRDRYTFRTEVSGGAGQTWSPFVEGDYQRAP